MTARCVNCGAAAEHDHHVVPRSLGGVATVPLCAACHGKAHGGRGFRPTGELTRAALAAKKKRGERAGAVPYGYSADAAGRLVECPAEMELIALTKHMRANGKWVRGIVEALRRGGHTSRCGGSVDATQVVRLLAWAPVVATGGAQPYAEQRRALSSAQPSLFGDGGAK
mgnify:FL=1